MGMRSPPHSKVRQRRKTSSGAPLHIRRCPPSGMPTTTDINRRVKSKGISSTFW